MSAISEGAPFLNQQSDSFRRYHTKIKVVVHSHLHADPIYLSDDIITASLGKTIKGVGQASLSVLPRLPLLNLIYPNDLINIYFDVGDGSKWTRTFFGYIDRVEEEYQVSDDGVPSTLYHVICSDWQKAVEKTEIYFNPHLTARPEFSGEDFGVLNIAGSALRTSGVHVTGSPADMVVTVLDAHIGFGSQWVLPSSYPANTRSTVSTNDQRISRLLTSLQGRLSEDQLDNLRQRIESGETESLQRNLDAGRVTDGDTAILQSQGLDEASWRNLVGETGDINTDDISDPVLATAFTRVENSLQFRQAVFGSTDASPEEDSVRKILSTYFATIDQNIRTSRSIFSVVNSTDFVERTATDGWAVDFALWEKQGSLGNIVRSVSNEIMNELVYDLRPILANEDQLNIGTQWDREDDDIAENEGGVRYEPAIVFREYPFSTIYSLDARNVRANITSDTGPSSLGIVYFGAIFSNKKNDPGRHIVEIPSINVESILAGNSADTPAKKHLDVAVVSETEVRSSRLGRSDADHFNLFELFIQNPLGTAQRHVMADLLPLVTPIHIMRHGLRVRSLTSRFGIIPQDAAQLTAPPPSTQVASTAPATPATPATPPTPAEAPEAVTVNSTPLIAPVGASPDGRRQRLTSPYRYRRGNITRGSKFWHFHNGVDIGPLAIDGSASDGVIPVLAIADGYVVASAPNGVYGMYGEFVVIWHPQFSEGRRNIYSVYAHLYSRTPEVGNTENNRNKATQCTAAGHGPGSSQSRFDPIFIRQGTPVGTMGRTSSPRSRAAPSGPSAVFSRQSIPHLHFEICYNFPTKHPSTADIYYSTEFRDAARETVRPGLRPYISNQVSPRSERPATPVSARSINPEGFYASKGLNLRDLIVGLATDASVVTGLTVDEPNDGGGEEPPDDEDTQDSRTVEDEERATAASAATTNQVQGRVNVEFWTRVQAGRWALLQDHWYQHNLEYTSGTIVMRGAPEIRVGYRLDILERDQSFYVEGVNHSWAYPNNMNTTLQVTRGQPNNPFPAYVTPASPGFQNPRKSRRARSRLAANFIIPDPIAVRRSISLRANTLENQRQPIRELFNFVDAKDFWETLDYAEYPDGLIAAQETRTDPRATPAVVASAYDEVAANDAAIAAIEYQNNLDRILESAEELSSVSDDQDLFNETVNSIERGRIENAFGADAVVQSDWFTDGE